MATAVRLTKLDSDGNPVTNINFDAFEIMNTEVAPVIETVTQRSQKGAPTLFIIADEYAEIEIEFLIYGTATETKLTELRNFILANGIVRVYPKYRSDPSTYWDCFVDPETIPVQFGFSGYSRGNKKVKIKFIETDQSSQYVVSEEITLE